MSTLSTSTMEINCSLNTDVELNTGPSIYIH